MQLSRKTGLLDDFVALNTCKTIQMRQLHRLEQPTEPFFYTAMDKNFGLTFRITQPQTKGAVGLMLQAFDCN